MLLLKSSISADFLICSKFWMGPAWNTTHQHAWELLLLTDLHSEVDRQTALRSTLRQEPYGSQLQARSACRDSELMHLGSNEAFEPHKR